MNHHFLILNINHHRVILGITINIVMNSKISKKEKLQLVVFQWLQILPPMKENLMVIRNSEKTSSIILLSNPITTKAK